MGLISKTFNRLRRKVSLLLWRRRLRSCEKATRRTLLDLWTVRAAIKASSLKECKESPVSLQIAMENKRMLDRMGPKARKTVSRYPTMPVFKLDQTEDLEDLQLLCLKILDNLRTDR